jgi:N-acetylgalactosamine kinase
VALVKLDDVKEVLAHVKQAFFRSRLAAGIISEDVMDEMLFASRPSSGAAIVRGL